MGKYVPFCQYSQEMFTHFFLTPSCYITMFGKHWLHSSKADVLGLSQFLFSFLLLTKKCKTILFTFWKRCTIYKEVILT